MCDMVIAEFVDLEKIDVQTNKQTQNRETKGDEKPIAAMRLYQTNEDKKSIAAVQGLATINMIDYLIYSPKAPITMMLSRMHFL